MHDTQLDPFKAVTFDRNSGLVYLEGASCQLLVSAAAFSALCAAAGSHATSAFGHEIGTIVGRRFAGRICGVDTHPDLIDTEVILGASAQTVMEHLGDELALAGFGALSMERWGQALVLTMDHSPLGAEGDHLLRAILEAALDAATGRDIRAVLFDRDTVRARFLIASDAVAKSVQTWLAGSTTSNEAGEVEQGDNEQDRGTREADGIEAHVDDKALETVEEPAPASTRQPKQDTVLGDEFVDLEEEPPPESGEVESQRMPDDDPLEWEDLSGAEPSGGDLEPATEIRVIADSSSFGTPGSQRSSEMVPMVVDMTAEVMRRPSLQEIVARFAQTTGRVNPTTFGELLDMTLELSF